MKKVLIQIKESVLFAFLALKVNRIRTLLSLLGITIGIFTVISVFTLVDSLEIKIRSSVESLGNDVVFIQKWPWGFGGEYPWWKYYQRPLPKVSELDAIKRRSNTIENAAFMVTTQRDVSFEGKSIKNISLIAASFDYKDIMPLNIEQGRYLTILESNSGKNVCIIGAEIASNLFGGENPIGKQIKVLNRKTTIIGVFKREGEDMFGQSADNMVFVAVNFARTLLDLNSQSMQPSIIVKPKINISSEEMIDELTGIMRSIRKLKPKADDNFALNEITTLKNNFDGLFATVSLAGWFIGGLSLLVGGFGIANIMFVSVKERTKVIGIQKALGAKNYFILLQFLFESVFLSLIGGLVGLFIVFLIVVIIQFSMDIEIVLTLGNIMVGIFVSLIIGLIAGMIPAYLASRLSPVEAIRTN